MIKADIVDRLFEEASIPRPKAITAVETVIDALRQALGAGDRIELRGFGVFQVKPRKRGIGRNPRTGKEVRIPPGRTIRFKPGKDLQNIVVMPPSGKSKVYHVASAGMTQDQAKSACATVR